jgi:hypothetical protein
MDSPEELARRLTASLAQPAARDRVATTADEAVSLAALAANLHTSLAALPAATRRLIHAADSGFASTGQWVDDAINAQTEQLRKLARATGMVASWLAANGAAAERVFVTRGHIRGWAHRWRTEEKGTAQVDSDPEFVAFASACLTHAGITGDHASMLKKALGPDWRTAADD